MYARDNSVRAQQSSEVSITMWRNGKPPLHPDMYESRGTPHPIVLDDAVDDQRDDDVIDLTLVDYQGGYQGGERKHGFSDDHSTNATRGGSHSPVRRGNGNFSSGTAYREESAEYESFSPKHTSRYRNNDYDKMGATRHLYRANGTSEQPLNMDRKMDGVMVMEEFDDVVESRRMETSVDKNRRRESSPRSPAGGSSPIRNFDLKVSGNLSPIRSSHPKSPPSPGHRSTSSSHGAETTKQSNPSSVPTATTSVTSVIEAEEEYARQQKDSLFDNQYSESVVKRYSNKLVKDRGTLSPKREATEERYLSSPRANGTKYRRSVRFQSESPSLGINPGRSVDPVIAPEGTDQQGNSNSIGGSTPVHTDVLSLYHSSNMKTTNRHQSPISASKNNQVATDSFESRQSETSSPRTELHRKRTLWTRPQKIVTSPKTDTDDKFSAVMDVPFESPSADFDDTKDRSDSSELGQNTSSLESPKRSPTEERTKASRANMLWSRPWITGRRTEDLNHNLKAGMDGPLKTDQMRTELSETREDEPRLVENLKSKGSMVQVVIGDGNEASISTPSSISREMEKERQMLTERRSRVLEKARALLASPKTKEIKRKSNDVSDEGHRESSEGGFESEGQLDDVGLQATEGTEKDSMRHEINGSKHQKKDSGDRNIPWDPSLPFDENTITSETSVDKPNERMKAENSQESVLESFNSIDRSEELSQKISRELLDDTEMSTSLEIQPVHSETPSVEEKAAFDSEATRRIVAALNGMEVNGTTEPTAAVTALDTTNSERTKTENVEASDSVESRRVDSSGNETTSNHEVETTTTTEQPEAVRFVTENKSPVDANVISMSQKAAPSSLDQPPTQSSTEGQAHSSLLEHTPDETINGEISKDVEQLPSGASGNQETPGMPPSPVLPTHDTNDEQESKPVAPPPPEYDVGSRQELSHSESELVSIDGRLNPYGSPHHPYRREVMWSKKRSSSLPRTFARSGNYPARIEPETAFDHLRATIMKLDVPDEANIAVSSSDDHHGNHDTNATPLKGPQRIEMPSIDAALSSFSHEPIYGSSARIGKNDNSPMPARDIGFNIFRRHNDEEAARPMESSGKSAQNEESISLLQKSQERNSVKKPGSSDGVSQKSSTPLGPPGISLNSHKLTQEKPTRAMSLKPSSNRNTPLHHNGARILSMVEPKGERGADESDSNDRDNETREDTDSKLSLVSYLGSEDSDLDTNFESSTVPMIVRMLDKGCAWLEGHNCGFESPSLLKESKSKAQGGGTGLLPHSSNFSSKNLKKKAPLVNKYASGRLATKRITGSTELKPRPSVKKTNNATNASASPVSKSDAQGGVNVISVDVANEQLDNSNDGEVPDTRDSSSNRKTNTTNDNHGTMVQEKRDIAESLNVRSDDVILVQAEFDANNGNLESDNTDKQTSGTSILHPIDVETVEDHRTRSPVDPPVVLSRSEGESTINLLSLDGLPTEMIQEADPSEFTKYFHGEERRSCGRDRREPARVGGHIRERFNAGVPAVSEARNGSAVSTPGGKDDVAWRSSIQGMDGTHDVYLIGATPQIGHEFLVDDNTGVHVVDDGDELFVLSESENSGEGGHAGTRYEQSTDNRNGLTVDVEESSDPPEDTSGDSRGRRSPIRRPKEDPRESQHHDAIHQMHSRSDYNGEVHRRGFSVDPEEEISGFNPIMASLEEIGGDFAGREEPNLRSSSSKVSKKSHKSAKKSHKITTQIDATVFRNLTEEERLAALELAERLRSRAQKLKKRRKKREKRFKLQHATSFGS